MKGKSQFRSDKKVNLTKESVDEIASSPYFNEDLKPTSSKDRKWGTYNYFSFWIGLCICITTYMIASGLMALGLTAGQSLVAIVLGQLIVLVPMLLDSIPGTKYGIPFPVYARISFGLNGAQITTILRGIAGAGWFSIMIWLGGEAMHVLLVKFAPSFGFPGSIWICYVIFLALNVGISLGGPHRIKKFTGLGAPIMVVLCLALLIWGLKITGGLEAVFMAVNTQAQTFATTGDFLKVFLPAMVGTTAYWATIALNIPDVTRYAKDQKSQLVGQAAAMPLGMLFLSFISVIATTAGMMAFGQLYWDPVQLMANFSKPIVFVAAIGFIIATLNVNMGANVISPVNDIINLAPKKINWKTGVIILAVISIIMQPWKLLSTYAAFFYGWMNMLAIFMAPLAGIFIVDFFIIKKQRLVLKDLYRKEGIYYYKNGFNVKAVIALVISVVIALLGKYVPALSFINQYTYVVSILLGAVIYYILKVKDKEAYISETEFEEITSKETDGNLDAKSIS